MAPKELKKLVKTLRTLGVTQYDDGQGLKLSLAAEPVVNRKAPRRLPPKEEKEIKHKIENYTSLMKLDDMSLVDRMFPDHYDLEQEDEH